MHFNRQLFKVSIIQTKLFGLLDFELSRFHCIYQNRVDSLRALPKPPPPPTHTHKAPLRLTQTIGATDFVDSYCYHVSLSTFWLKQITRKHYKSGCALLHAFQFFLTTPLGLKLALLKDWTHQSFISCAFNVLMKHHLRAKSVRKRTISLSVCPKETR